MGLLWAVLPWGVAALALLVAAALLFCTRHFAHWTSKGVAGPRPLPFVGSLKDVVLMRKPIGVLAKEVYDAHRVQPFVGLFAFDEPLLQIHDLALVRAVLVKDFQVFCDRSLHADEALDEIAARSIFNLTGERWRACRHALSPSFSPGKMKRMFQLVAECADLLGRVIEKDGREASPIPVYELAARYTVDVIASCAFGIQGHTLENPDADFRRILRLLFEFTPKEALGLVAGFLAPKLASTLGIKLIKPEVESFIMSTISLAIKEREERQIKRNDLLDSLIQLKYSGRIFEEGEHMTQQPEKQLKFDLIDIAGNSLAFLMAGFETAATTITFLLYELAMNTDVQEKLRQEIRKSAIAGKLTFESVHEMKYLDMVVQETLRKYPPLPFIDRVSNKTYTLPGTELTLKAGSRIIIPFYAFQMDSEYFPNPQQFDPERFSEENKKTHVHYSYMPFGEGPRSCVGIRFAMVQTKTAIANIILKYSVHPYSTTPKEIEFNPKTFLLQPKGNLELIFRAI